MEILKVVNTRKGDVTIREAQPGDLDAYRQIRLEALRDHPEAFTSDYATCLAWPEERWADRLGSPATAGSKVTFLVEESGSLAGMGGVFRGDSPKNAHVGTVVGIYVRPGWRGLGLGEALMDACEAWARQSGISILQLAVTGSNEFARQVYIRCGYRVYGVGPRALVVAGTYYDEVLMVKDLP